ncbi:MAG TPA: hypothetical protein VFE36_09815 [Candidatus Baltobacteraceae bacterium]|jgi:hypothetical protein|nr:hypothetical protein [Candidatus Baltobacteraceae bacterium]
MRKLAWALLPLILLALAGTGHKTPVPTPPPQCELHQGDRIVLYGSGDDPDVLAWDSRFRLRSYHAAPFDEAEQLLSHAVLEAAGTRAQVVACVAGFVPSHSFETPEDAVGIMILSGPEKGIGKWVIGSDTRLRRR